MTATQATADLSEARRLLGAGMKLVKMLPYMKRPEGDEWNKHPVTDIDPEATGYGLILAPNKLCSIDPDNVAKAQIGMRALGFDLEQFMEAGTRTRSSRRGSGGRSTFAAEGDLDWLSFRSKPSGTVIEFRASSTNLQDVIPGIVYRDKGGTLCRQDYANCKRLDDAPPLPNDLYAWWSKCSSDIEFRREQERLFFAALREDAQQSISTGNGKSLAYSAPGYRTAYNAAHKVEELLERHQYDYDSRTKRWSPPTATGAPAVRPVPGKDELWRSDHASDPLMGTFDAWIAFVVLDHAGDIEAAKRACEAEGLVPAESVSYDDFHAYMPMHSYIFVPEGVMWPAASVNARLPARDKMKPNAWLDQHKPVEQMTWSPGDPALIENKLIVEGGWFERPGARCFNLYHPPTLALGDAAGVAPWLDLLRTIYPDEHRHILQWLAHRVQRPQDKVNHALVLGGSPGIGKDTILEPVKYAVGPWNFKDVSPTHMLGRFNGFVKSVVLRVNEARDLGDVDRYAFHEHMKGYTAAPPDVLRCDEKHLREHYIPNVCGVIVTTNHKTDGLYLPADDRRHFVAWSQATSAQFPERYWIDLYRWYEDGGHGHVAAYLASLDLSGFDAKAPPPKTRAFLDIVDANRAPEDADLADVLDALGHPEVVTMEAMIGQAKRSNNFSFSDWLRDRKNRRNVPHRMEAAGYVPIRNDTAKDGLWRVGGRRQSVYAQRTLAVRDQLRAAARLAGIAVASTDDSERDEIDA